MDRLLANRKLIEVIQTNRKQTRCVDHEVERYIVLWYLKNAQLKKNTAQAWIRNIYIGT